jgi:transposase-like protein
MDRKRKRKSFSVVEKLNALDKLLENHNNFAKTSRDTGVHRKQLRNWKNQENELRGTPNKKHRKTVWFKRKPRFERMENTLVEWIRTERAAKRSVSWYNIEVQHFYNEKLHRPEFEIIFFCYCRNKLFESQRKPDLKIFVQALDGFTAL